MSFFEELSQQALMDEYFIELLLKAEVIAASSFFNIDSDSLSSKEFVDILRFADILSRSGSSEAKNKAYKTVSLLSEQYSEDELFLSFSKSILVRLGNFPALTFLEDSSSVEVAPPLEVVFERVFKEVFHAIPNSDHVFTDAQYEIYENLKKNNHYSFSGPTSLGKSFIIKSFIRHLISEHKGTDNIALLVPTRALINQMANQLKEEFSDQQGYKVLAHPIIPSAFKSERNRFIFVFTPERLISYLAEHDNPKLDYLFIDEAHKIVSEKDTRSPLYYHAILQAERKSVKLFFASPNIPNPDIFLRLFEKSFEESLCVKSSPVSQSRYFLDLVERRCSLLSDTGKEVGLDVNFDVIGFNSWLKKLSDGEKSIVYCNSKADTIELALEFAETLPVKNDPAVNEVIALVEEHLHKKYYLIDCLKKGVAFHFGNLPQRIREKVEELFSKKKIDYLFCTSTLLEGVNLPAKNIFILSNAIGLTKFSDIDFWNLCGRAGRLTKELSGNIICTRAENKKNRWNNPDADLKVVRKKEIKELEPQMISGKSNFFKNIQLALTDKEFTTSQASADQKKIWKHYANIALIHEIRGEDSVLRSNFISRSEGAKSILRAQSSQNTVPEKILESSSNIKAKYQNKIFNDVRLQDLVLQREVDYDAALNALNMLSDLYSWEVEESLGRDALYKSRDTLKYYAVLISEWANTKPLHLMIQTSIKYHEKKGEVWLVDKLVAFDKNNKRHLNVIINNLISDIDNFIRFKIRNYFENYNMLLKEKLGVENSGANWAEFLEYGTTDTRVIELQNYGVPRHLAQSLVDNFSQFMNFEDRTVLPFDKHEILSRMDVDSDEYKELSELILYG